MTSVRKLEVGLLKYYLVNTSQNNKQDKILEFFERMTELMQTQSEFKEWFAFPFVRNPRENSNFATYFTIQWQDTFFLSLHNFLSVILQAMPGPVLLNFESEHREIKDLQAENERLKQQIISLGEKPDPEFKGFHPDSYLTDRSHMDLVYDFSSLGEDTAIQETTTKSPRKFPFTSSPLHVGKKVDKTPSSKGKEDQSKSGFGMKELKSQKSSKLLPVISRPKKVTQKTSRSSSQDSSASSTSYDLSANQNSVPDSTGANQRIKKFEDARNKRKELMEGGADKTKSSDKKSADNKGDTRSDYNRSVSESGVQISSSKTSPRNTSRPVSKSVLETKPDCSSSPKTSDILQSLPQSNTVTMDTVSPLATATVATMLGTGISGNQEELQTFPPANSQTDNLPSTSGEGEQKPLETIHEKPFLLLSQDKYTEHRSAVSYARFSNSGQYIGSVDVDGVVKVWNWSPEANTAATVMSKSAFLSLEWASKSDRWLLLGNRSGNIRLFDVKEMKSFYEASADPSYPRIVNICSNPASPMFVCSATSGRSRSGSIGSDTGPSQDNRIGKLTIWDLKTMKTEKSLPLEPGPVCITSCSFNHNGQLLITGGVDGMIRLFDICQQRCITQWSAHTGDIRSIVYSADYNSCYSLGNDGKIINQLKWNVGKNSYQVSRFCLRS
ncbi:WD repeat-containing protein 91 [Mactra antiquata]